MRKENKREERLHNTTRTVSNINGCSRPHLLTPVEGNVAPFGLRGHLDGGGGGDAALVRLSPGTAVVSLVAVVGDHGGTDVDGVKRPARGGVAIQRRRVGFVGNHAPQVVVGAPDGTDGGSILVVAAARGQAGGGEGEARECGGSGRVNVGGVGCRCRSHGVVGQRVAFVHSGGAGGRRRGVDGAHHFVPRRQAVLVDDHAAAGAAQARRRRGDAHGFGTVTASCAANAPPEPSAAGAPECRAKGGKDAAAAAAAGLWLLPAGREVLRQALGGVRGSRRARVGPAEEAAGRRGAGGSSCAKWKQKCEYSVKEDTISGDRDGAVSMLSRFRYIRTSLLGLQPGIEEWLNLAGRVGGS